MRIIQFFLGLLFLPFISFAHYIARYVLKDELRRKDERYESLRDNYRSIKDELEGCKIKAADLERKRNRIINYIKKSKYRKFEINLTKDNEIVIIGYLLSEKHGDIYLIGEDGNHNFFDSKMNITAYIEDYLIVNDFYSNKENVGYGRVLVEALIRDAKKDKFKYITGELSSVDSYNFNKTIPFYESFGAKCELYKDLERKKLGKVTLNLT